MKKLLVTFAASIITVSAFAQARSIKNLFGHWECVDQKNERGSLEFSDSSKVYISFMGEKKTVASFDIDFSKTPYWFSFALKEQGETLVVKSFLYFIDDNNIKWEVFMPDEEGNPVSSEVVLLRRKSPAFAANQQ